MTAPSRTSSRSTLPMPPKSVLYVMCGIMAFAAVVALFGLQRGRQELVPVEDGRPSPSPTAPHAARADHRAPAARMPRDAAGTCRNLAPALPSQFRRSPWRRQACRTGAASDSSWRLLVAVGALATSCSVVSKVKQAVHTVEGNKATIDSFTQNLQSTKDTPFEATYTTTGSSPATVVYAVDPSSGGLRLPRDADGIQSRPTSSSS